MYVYVPGQLASKEDVDGAISFCTYLRNIWQLYIRLFVHFPVAMEICKLILQRCIFLILYLDNDHLLYHVNIYLRLHLSWFTCNIAHSILSLHSSAVSYFNLETLDFFGKFYSLRICQWFSLFVDISDIQYFAHKFYNRLRFVEGSGRD